MAIRVLDPSVVGRIAAGEVVERPSSVAKELIENAIDAGATAITVEIRGGGIEYLRVTDNGCGIAPNQVALAFENHATSKIQGAEQLDDIRTLGFRGEALPSIAAVSHVEVTTREKSAASGVKLVIDGGHKQPATEAGCPEGTTVVMRDLFFNVPVRRTFLKKPNYEGALVNDLVTRMILGNPSVSFRFINNGKTVYHSFGDGSLKHAVFAVYGSETAEKMKDVDASCGGMRIRGMIGVGELSKATRAHQTFFINGRSVRCNLMTQVLEQVCRSRVTIGTYPMCALTLTIPPSSVDVNVHPNKLEVRFRDEQAVRLSAENILEQAFAGESVLTFEVHESPKVAQTVTVRHEEPKTDKIQTEVANIQTEVKENQTEVTNKQVEVKENQTEVETQKPVLLHPDMTLREDIAAPMPPKLREKMAKIVPSEIMGSKKTEEATAEVRQIAIEPDLPQGKKEEKPLYRVIGTLFRTYILVELEEALLLIDQHAAHERIMYEKFMARLNSGEPASQNLLVPLILDVTSREMELISENREALEAAGYQVEPFGDRSVSLRGVPFIMGRADAKPAFAEVVGSLDRIGEISRENRMGEIATMACKAAVKAGDRLADSEIEALISQMRETGASPTCPHGRPVSRTLTKREIEKLFKRIQ